MELRAHQKKALSELGNGKVLRGGVGSGKTLTAVAYYDEREKPRDVYVITTAKKRDSLDWEKDFAAYGIGKARDATVGGILTVDSWNNVANYLGVRDAFFVFDEQRAVGSGAWAKAFIKIARANRWILLSATPGDTWLDYIPLFLANNMYKNRTEFLREHVIFSAYTKFPKVERYIAVGRLVRQRNAILVEMPFESHTVRIIRDVDVAHDSEALERITKDRWNIYKEKPLKDVAELFSASRRLVNSDETRLSAVRQLMEIHPRLIVFYNFDYELELLRTLAEPSASTMTVMDSEMTAATLASNSRTSTSTTTSSRPRTTPHPVSTSTTTMDGETTSQTREGTECQTSTSTEEQTPTPAGISSSGSSSRSSSISSSSASAATQRSTASSRTSSTGTTTSTTTSGSGAPSRVGVTQNSTGTTHSDMGALTVAEWNGHKHEPIPDTERWLYLVQYIAGAEGWNCVETNATVFWSLTYSYKNWEQAFGRIDRLNTPYTNLHYYILQSQSWIDQAVRRSLDSKKSFNESAYLKKEKIA